MTTTPKEPYRIFADMSDGSVLSITVPGGAKVTFGPLYPGKPGYDNPNMRGREGLYLRIYRTQGEQLAVFPNVISFRADTLDVHILSHDGEFFTWIPLTPERTVLKGMKDTLDDTEGS